jgi:hypothetical protein
LTIDPASPAAIISTSIPVSTVNVAKVSSLTDPANESCAISRSLSGRSASSPPQAATMATMAITQSVFRILIISSVHRER